MAEPTSFALWCQAGRENPGDPAGRRLRYVRLMVEHGHIVGRDLDDDRPLFPCRDIPPAG